MSKNLIARIAVAAVAIPAILWICYQGGWWLYGMVLLFALLGFSEFLLNEGHRANRPVFWVSLVVVFWFFTGLSLYGSDMNFLPGFPAGIGFMSLLPVLVVFFGIGLVGIAALLRRRRKNR